MPSIDHIDRAIICATQAGLPLAPYPYHDVAAAIGLDPSGVVSRMQRMLDTGMIRRIGVVPNHYALGLVANAMTVWDVDDAALMRLGPQVGGLDFVTHCYHRPRRLPLWPYNLFAMVHGRTRAEVDEKIGRIGSLLAHWCRGSEVLVSKRILKKAGLRLAVRPGER
jgi:DNA-binding Lrp family transcriptional regulator